MFVIKYSFSTLQNNDESRNQTQVLVISSPINVLNPLFYLFKHIYRDSIKNSTFWPFLFLWAFFSNKIGFKSIYHDKAEIQFFYTGRLPSNLHDQNRYNRGTFNIT